MIDPELSFDVLQHCGVHLETPSIPCAPWETLRSFAKAISGPLGYSLRPTDAKTWSAHQVPEPNQVMTKRSLFKVFALTRRIKIEQKVAQLAPNRSLRLPLLYLLFV